MVRFTEKFAGLCQLAINVGRKHRRSLPKEVLIHVHKSAFRKTPKGLEGSCAPTFHPKPPQTQGLLPLCPTLPKATLSRSSQRPIASAPRWQPRQRGISDVLLSSSQSLGVPITTLVLRFADGMQQRKPFTPPSLQEGNIGSEPTSRARIVKIPAAPPQGQGQRHRRQGLFWGS